MYKADQLISLLSDRRILIAGYGREGRSSHNLLSRLLPDCHPDIADNDQAAARLLQQASQPYDLIIKSPGIPTMKFEGLCDPAAITSQTDLFLQVYHDLVIGITGTKGKSTTTTLIHHVLEHSYGSKRNVILAGNMGIPLFDILDQVTPDSLIVAELSCHQLENIHRAPHIGIILNLFQEHLDHYHSYHDYQMAKMRMLLQQQAGDHCFYCTDSGDLVRIVEPYLSTAATTLHPYALQDAQQAGTDSLPSLLKGDHNLSNIFVARQVCALVGVADSQFAEALASFQGLPHRLELVGTYRGITFYNDSISTIPQATIAALKALHNVDTLILGGYDRGIDYSTLEHFFISLIQTGQPIRNIAFVGKAGRRMHSELSLMCQHPLNHSNAVLIEDDYTKIVDWCFQVTAPGKICLLSPAAASYDSFKNFEERGDTFCKLVRNHQ